MLCSRFLKLDHGRQHGRAYRTVEEGYRSMYRFYERTLLWVMDHRRATMAFSLAILLGTFLLYKIAPKGFIPSEDTGRIVASTETAEGTSFEAMSQHQQEVAAILGKDPNVDSYTSSVGSGGGVSSTNQGRIIVKLKPRNQLRLSADETIRELQPRLARVPGIRVYLQNPPVINVGGRISKSQYQFTLQSPDLSVLYSSVNDLLEGLSHVPGLQDVTSDLQIANPEVDVAIDRDRAAALGVSAEQIEETLYDAFGSRQVSTIFTSTDQYWVIMELQPEFQRDITALQNLYVATSTGTLVP
ncbi:MAG: efflux RND transporter permease subunit, partial [Candidatus Eisenbacteria bacterium]